MRKWISVLGGLLAVQLVLAVAVNLAGEDYEAFEPEQRLIVFAENAVDGLRIEDDSGKLVLAKQDGRWLLPDAGGFPASEVAVEGLLDKLAALKKGWPVATTAGAARRFKVADDQFDRKLAVLSGEQVLAELYVGTSPGFRKVHVRPATEDAVYAVALNTWEVNAKADDWIDKEILKLDESGIERVEMPGFVIQRDGGELRLSGLSETQETDTGEVRALLGKLAAMRIQSILGTGVEPEYRQDEPAFEIKVARKQGDDLTYRFSKPKDASYYVLKRSDLGYYLKIAEFTVKPLEEAKRDKLIRARTGEADAAGEAAGIQPSETVGQAAE